MYTFETVGTSTIFAVYQYQLLCSENVGRRFFRRRKKRCSEEEARDEALQHNVKIFTIVKSAPIHSSG